jgi:hypothetical protein
MTGKREKRRTNRLETEKSKYKGSIASLFENAPDKSKDR